jgi:hypothetical protein
MWIGRDLSSRLGIQVEADLEGEKNRKELGKEKTGL